MTRFLSICLGGALGTGARYLLSTWMLHAAGADSRGTLTVNVLGPPASVILAFLGLTSLSPTLRLTLTTGFLGATTHSTFNHETSSSSSRRAGGSGPPHVGVTLLGCLAAGPGPAGSFAGAA
jgi:CrcB protein